MKTTKSKLKTLIKETVSTVLKEYEKEEFDVYEIYFVNTENGARFSTKRSVEPMRGMNQSELDAELDHVKRTKKTDAIELDNSRHPRYVGTEWANDEGEIYQESQQTNEAPRVMPTTEQKKFAEEIVERIKERQRRKGFGDMHIDEAIRQMVEMKLAKEGWRKTGSEESPSTKTKKKPESGRLPSDDWNDEF
jgi:hypothetical protein